MSWDRLWTKVSNGMDEKYAEIFKIMVTYKLRFNLISEQIFDDVIPRCTKCDSLVKPDIVFFGENLPEKFYQLPEIDYKACDLLIIMGTLYCVWYFLHLCEYIIYIGTSLEVQPFASLVDRVDSKCVRLLINREAVGNDRSMSSKFKSLLFGEGLNFDAPGNKRDVAWLGDCDDGIWHLATELGLKVLTIALQQIKKSTFKLILLL